MASKSSLIFLISTTLALLVVSYFLFLQDKQEGFQNPSYTTKNLTINTCPTYTTEIQTAKGSTDCCQGDMVDGKCNGKTFCTKSPAYPGVPSCIDAWRAYFEKKGADFCPPTMPNYYEDITRSSSPKGCSAGPISTDGKMPTDTRVKQCKVYSSETDNKTKIDSCYLEKLRAKIQCPVVNGQSPEADMLLDRNTFIAFRCSYPFELGMPQFCLEKKSAYDYIAKIYGPNWKSYSTLSNVDEIICENYIARREAARSEANRLQAEQKAREAAEAKAKAEADARASAEAIAKKRAEELSRLQQQLDEANRKAQQCKK